MSKRAAEILRNAGAGGAVQGAKDPRPNENVLMASSAFLTEPLQGKTSLSKVFWVYGVLGSILYSALELFLDPGNEPITRIYVVGGLLYSAYVTVATYRCAGNCNSAALAKFVRVSAVISLVALPVIAYLELTGAIGAALSLMSGEQ